MNGASTLRSEVATNEPPHVSHMIALNTIQDIQIFGTLAALIGIIGPLIAGPLSDRVHARFPGVARHDGQSLGRAGRAAEDLPVLRS